MKLGNPPRDRERDCVIAVRRCAAVNLTQHRVNGIRLTCGCILTLLFQAGAVTDAYDRGMRMWRHIQLPSRVTRHRKISRYASFAQNTLFVRTFGLPTKFRTDQDLRGLCGRVVLSADSQGRGT
jgi:hypothetical protein